MRCRKRRAGGGNGVILGCPFLYGKIKAALYNAAFCFQERACEEKSSSEKSESSSNVSLISFAARAICCFVCVAV